MGIIEIVKNLSNVIPTTEFVLLVGIIVSILVYIIKTLGVFAVKKGLFSQDTEKDTDLKYLNERIGLLVTENALNESIDKVSISLDQLREQSFNHNNTMKDQITDILFLKKDLEILSESIKREFFDLNIKLKSHDNNYQHVLEAIREVMHRMQELDQRIINQINKVDDYAKSAVPEFRTYHKELSKELTSISKDIALVERSIQTQLHNINTVKLR